MTRQIIAILACLAVCSTTTPLWSAEISGAWKVDTQNGPTPVCSLVQTGDKLSGSCVGPQATGTVTGTVVGSIVRWRWQWTAYAGNSAAAFDFVGTLQPDNSIAGQVERNETGFSSKFTATKQIAARQPTSPEALDKFQGQRVEIIRVRPNRDVPVTKTSAQIQQERNAAPAPPEDMNNIPDAQHAFSGIMSKPNPNVAPNGSVYGPSSPPLRPYISPLTVQRLEQQVRQLEQQEPAIPHDILRQADAIFGTWITQGSPLEAQRRQFIIDQINAAADRRQGHSYTVRVTK